MDFDPGTWLSIRPHTALTFNGMNLIDWTILFVVTFSLVSGFMRGLVRSLISLVGLIAGVLLAIWYCQPLAVHLAPWITSPPAALVTAFAGIVAVSIIAASLLGRLLRTLCKAAGLGFFDRLGGAVFGLVRGILLLAALLLPMAPLLNNLRVTQESLLLPYLRTASVGVCSVMPRRFRGPLSTGIRLPPQPASDAATSSPYHRRATSKR